MSVDDVLNGELEETPMVRWRRMRGLPHPDEVQAQDMVEYSGRQLNLRIPVELHRMVFRLAEAQNLTISAFAREAVRDAVERETGVRVELTHIQGTRRFKSGSRVTQDYRDG